MCGIFAVQLDDPTPGIPDALREGFERIRHRGPDQSSLEELVPGVILGFHRLAINDPTSAGMQPFFLEREDLPSALLVNGEIYNDAALRPLARGYAFHSGSDCEVVLPLIDRRGLLDTVRGLDAEFALVWYDSARDALQAARDPIGIRPLFMGTPTTGGVAFASEAKALTPFCGDVRPFPPGHVYVDGRLLQYRDPGATRLPRVTGTLESVAEGIRERLTAAVVKRLHADVPIGSLLSGGLDSSLVCAIAARHLDVPFPTFSIGCDRDAIDNRYAELAARHMGAEHTTVTFTHDEAVAALEPVIAHLESWDITTVRASVGMFLVCQHIRAHTGVKVLLTGEVSDELFGYKYTDFAPTPQDFQDEAARRVRELYLYDVLRADRCIAAHGLEARVPFSDDDFVAYVMRIDPALKVNTTGMGKYLLRKAFEGTGLLPDPILWREKAAFSDAVGHSVVDHLKAHAASRYDEAAVARAAERFPFHPPISAEALLYREIFESLYPGRAAWIPDYWLPNRSWPGCDVTDPSARVLANYGASGV